MTEQVNSRFRAYAESNIGCVREENQDTYAVHAIGEGMLAVVCDGMGGAAGGRVAADMACDAFCRGFSSTYEEMIGREMHTAFDMHRVYNSVIYAANQVVFEQAAADEALRGMGTTIAAAYVIDNSLYVTNVGDSRVYLLHRGELVRISHDDSLVQQMIDSGQISEAEAAQSEGRHILTRALGTTPYVECGFYTATLEKDDILLLCSDGLTAHYSDRELAAFLQQPGDTVSLVRGLIEGTCARGGQDNVTVVCLMVG